jgi:peptide/nickel transport system substrate-binding protein
MVLRRRSTFAFWMAPLLATGSLGSAKAAPARDDLTIAFPIDIPHWDPEGQTGGLPMSILNCVFDTPITQTPDMRLAPRAVTDWHWAPDKMSLDIRLRDDIYFHNGDKMTTEDLKYTFDRYQTETLPQGGTFRRVKEIRVKSDTEATFVLKLPTATLPARLAIFGSAIIPKAYLEKVGMKEFMAHPIGSGPYKLVSHLRDSRIILEAFDKYWGGRAPIKNVTFEIVKDPTARVAAIEAGRADLTLDVPLRTIDHLSKLPGITAKARPYPAQLQVLMVSDRGAFKDKNVRLAVHHAIDKAALSKAFYNGVAVPISVLAPPGYPGDVPGFTFPYSEGEAKKLMAQSGYSPEHPVKIDFTTTNGVYANDFDVARAIVQMLKKVGADANLEVVELSKYFALNQANKLPEMTLFHWSNPTDDPEIGPGGILDSSRPFSAWKGKEAGDIVAGLLAETDDAKRMAGYVSFNRYAVEQGWTIPLLQPTMTFAHKSNLNFMPYKTGWLAVNSIAWK